MGAVRAGAGLAVLARSAGFPPTGRSGERAACRPADELQGRDVRGRKTQRAAARAGSRYRRREARWARCPGKTQGVRLAVRAAGEVVDAADRQLPLRDAAGAAVDPRGSALSPRALAADLR